MTAYETVNLTRLEEPYVADPYVEPATNNNGSPNTPEYTLFNFILHGVFTNVIGLVGLLGNILCILILRRMQMRTKCSTNVILAALASFDGLVVITSMFMFG